MFLTGNCAFPATVALPVIDRQDMRFTPLSINGEPFKRWVLCIGRDRQGFLWLGTTHGLYRYDGYSLNNYVHDDKDPRSLSDDTIWSVFKDRSGTLWIGTNGGGLERFDPVRDSFIHCRHNPNRSGSLSGDIVRAILQDHDGLLWVATSGGLDRLDPATGEFVHYRHDPNIPGTLSSSSINRLFEDREHNLWAGTDNGLNRIEHRTHKITRFVHSQGDAASIGGDLVGAIWQDWAGQLWVAAGNVLDRFDSGSGKFTHYSFDSSLPGEAAVAGITSIREDETGALWLSTADSGILRLDEERKEFSRYTADPFDPTRLSDNNVYGLFEDPEGLMWACSKGGVNHFFARRRGFVRYQNRKADAKGLRDNVIWSVQEDSRGFDWIGTRRGLYRLDRKTGYLDLYRHDPKDRYSLSYDTVTSIREDGGGTLWFDTYGGGLDRFDRNTGRFVAYRHAVNKTDSLSSDRVLCLLVDHKGFLWVGTGDAGLNRLDPRTGGFKHYGVDPGGAGNFSDNNIKALLEDHQGILWIATNNGLNRFDPGTEQVTVYRPGKPGGLSSDIVECIHEDRSGTLWVGCRNGLNRMDRTRGTFTLINERDGLPDNDVETIVEGDQGDLWLATGYGLSHFDPRTKAFVNYSETDGLAGNNMAPFGSEAACRTRDGQIIVGSTEGVTAFRPDQVYRNPYVPPVVLTDFLLSGNSVRPGGSSPLKRPIWDVDGLTLDHTQSIFSIEFSALSYAAPDKNRYRFRLEPFEDWNEGSGKRRPATYTNLPAGRYLFRVQGSNNAGVWNEDGGKLAIVVLPPWWQTWWFRAAILVCLAALIMGAFRARVKRLKLAAADLEVQVADRTRELMIAKDAAESASRAKSAFLAAMSHELRTPLNAILGFSNLMRERGASVEQRRDLEIINRSGTHLLGLINDVLDLAKIEAGRSVVEIGPCDPRSVLEDVEGMIRGRAEAKQLAFYVLAPSQIPVVRTDAARLRQILINLLANAVQYTDHGSVSLTLRIDERTNSDDVRLVFEVADTGMGIAPEEQDRVFEPFVQATTNRSRKGTGLGLAIAKQLLVSMDGTIELESALGRGSCFRVKLPAGRAQQAEVTPVADGGQRIAVLEPSQEDYRVLVVDDEPENSMLFDRLLGAAGFRDVQIVHNGSEAVERFQHWRPHFIWMDLQMPGMDGIEATRRIRELEGGREVKIAAVTASRFKSQINDVIAAGMDDFVLKPYRPMDIFECMARHTGARFKDEERPQPATDGAAVPLRPEHLTVLPEGLRAQFREAVVALDVNRISDLIDLVSKQDAKLGMVLRSYADRLRFSAILNAMDGVKEASAG
jgi:signal transduction histidine kinase/ligand-binding sensor domain-containing protein/CheY-like chemotaxis protein